MPGPLSPEARDIFDRLAQSGKNQTDLADVLGIERNKISKAKVGERQFKAGEVLRAREWLDELAGASSPSAISDDDSVPSVPMVGIQNIDLAFGLGATFTDSPVEVEVLQFPKAWVDSITSSPPTFLTWTRGRGDSMAPTIHDGDLVLLDRSQRKVAEQDALWAYTIGDVGAIKRLRVKGDRFVIQSDNASVSDDEEPIDFVNIVARVIFVGKRI